MNLKSILQSLQKNGLRTTKLRQAILEILSQSSAPVSAQYLLEQLEANSLTPSPSTLYRQLDTLIEHGIVTSPVMNSKIQYFELLKDHHHHFVCEGCQKVEDVGSDDLESSLQDLESALKKRGLFIQKHELTLFGECSACH